MKILMVSDAYPPLFGGATRAAQQMSRQLHLRGHQVAVATAWQRGLPAVEDDDGVEVHRLRGLVSRIPAFSSDPVRYTPPPFPDPELGWRLRRLRRSFGPHVVHSYGWLTYSCLLALWGTDTPLVLAAREYANLCAVRTLVRQGREAGSSCSGPAWGKCLECSGSFYGQPKGIVATVSILAQRGALRRRVDALHAVSRFCEQMVNRYLMVGKVVPTAVLPDFREDHLELPPDHAILARLPTTPFILFVGSFRRIKGDELLIQAYRRLDNPPPLVMVGARSAEPLPDFPSGVVPLIDVPHGTLMAIWERARFGVCPSVVSEALGNTVHEGMSRGKAVIGTRPSGHEDIIRHGHDGLLVPSGDLDALTDAIAGLLADPHLCESMGAAARISARRFDEAVVMPRIERFLQDVAISDAPHARPAARVTGRRAPACTAPRRRGTMRSNSRTAVDVVAVCTASTPGNRRSELELVAGLLEVGATVAVASTDYGMVGRIRKSLNLMDVTNALSNRLAVLRALDTVSAGAFIYGTGGAALLEPRTRLRRAGIRFDALAVDNRVGYRHAGQRLLERRMVAEAALLLPWSAGTWPQIARAHHRTPISLPTPVEPFDSEAAPRGAAVVCYAGAPDKKRLDLMIGAWGLAELTEPYYLAVTGITPGEGRRWLARRGLHEPRRVRWMGHLTETQYRALTSAAAIYLAASRYEDYGIGQLEALADGALLVTTPSPGPYEALPLARSLDPRLISDESSAPSLARVLRYAHGLSETDRAHYRERARTLIAPYSRQAFRERLRTEVLPVLLD